MVDNSAKLSVMCITLIENGIIYSFKYHLQCFLPQLFITDKFFILNLIVMKTVIIVIICAD